MLSQSQTCLRLVTSLTFMHIQFSCINRWRRASGDLSGSRRSVVYTREQLLALCSTGKLTGYKPDVPPELKRRKRGRRSGVMCRNKKKRFKPTLPTVITGNVRSIYNKMDELTALTRHQREYRECSMMLFTETWLTEQTPFVVVLLTKRSGRRAR